MVKTFQVYLPTKNKCTYSCIHCRTHLADHDDLISKSFQGSQGRAYLFNRVVNVTTGPAEERYLLTGLHAVADINCDSCKTTIGWKYEQAFESSQKYKEGKYIIELAHLIKDNGWENNAVFGTSAGQKKGALSFSSPWDFYSSSNKSMSKKTPQQPSKNINMASTSSGGSASASPSSSPASSVSGSPTSTNSMAFW